MPVHLTRSLKVFFTFVLLACTVALATSRAFYTDALVSAFFSLTLASTVILHLRVRPYWSDILLVLGSSAFLAFLDFRVLGFHPRFMTAFSFLGLSSLLILGIRTTWAAEDDRKLLLYAFVPALLFVVSDWGASTLLAITDAAQPKTLDLYLYSFDCSLRVQLSFLMGAGFLKWHWLKIAGLLFYIGLPIPLALVYAGQLVRKKEKALPIMLAFLFTGPLGVLFYNLFPAAGPAHVFGSNFPLHPLSISQAAHLFLEPTALQAPRNAIPSLHMAWVLLAWWYSRGLAWWSRGVALAFVVFTVVGTLGTGEHYFIDLVVACPFALMIRGIFSASWPRSWRQLAENTSQVHAFLFGALGTLAWLGLLRFGIRLFWISPVVPWALVAATVVLASVWEYRLWRAEDLRPRAVNLHIGALSASEAPGVGQLT